MKQIMTFSKGFLALAIIGSLLGFGVILLGEYFVARAILFILILALCYSAGKLIETF